MKTKKGRQQLVPTDGESEAFNEMKHHNHFTIIDKEKSIAFIILIILAIAVGLWIGTSVCKAAEEQPISCWILCKPGSQVNIRRTPGKDGIIDGFLECGEGFRTDGVCRNGFVHALGLTENGEGWIYCGFVVTDRPEKVYENYVCVARNRAACRRWCDGPQITGRIGWLYNGSNVTVFYRSEEWSVTSRGYVRSEWLEVDP